MWYVYLFKTSSTALLTSRLEFKNKKASDKPKGELSSCTKVANYFPNTYGIDDIITGKRREYITLNIRRVWPWVSTVKRNER